MANSFRGYQSGQKSRQEYHRRHRLVQAGKASWWKAFRTIEGAIEAAGI